MAAIQTLSPEKDRCFLQTLEGGGIRVVRVAVREGFFPPKGDIVPWFPSSAQQLESLRPCSDEQALQNLWARSGSDHSPSAGTSRNALLRSEILGSTRILYRNKNTPMSKHRDDIVMKDIINKRGAAHRRVC